MKPLENLGRGGYCSRCNTIKPIAEFTRYLTRAEALSRGYVAHVKVEVESTICKDCRPKPRPVSKLRAGEIRQRVSQGSLDPLTANLVLKKRNARAKLGRKVKRAQQAHRTWAKQLKEILAPMSAHITSVDNWLRYQAKTGTPPDAPSMVFMAAYLTDLRRARDHIKFEQLTRPGPPPHEVWQQFIPYEQRFELWKKWDALPPEERHRMVRTPPLLAQYKE